MKRWAFGRTAGVLAGALLTLPVVMQGGTAAADGPRTVLSGTITARFTGQPVPGACMALVDDQQAEVLGACADANGHYELVGTVTPGYYRIVARAPGFGDTWHATSLGTDAPAFASATPEFVDTGGFLDLGLRPPGIGGLRGQLTDDTGAPVPFVRVQYIDEDGRHFGSEVFTNQSGEYAFSGLFPGHYILQYTDFNTSQYYHQKEKIGDADLIVVTAGPDTVADEQLIPPGTITVTLTDQDTRKPVRTFCAFVSGEPQKCTTTGSVTVRADRGVRSVFVDPEPAYFRDDVNGISVVSGQDTPVNVPVRPGVGLRTTIRDAATGQPLANTCVQPVKVGTRGLDGAFTTQGTRCSNADGVVAVGPLEKGAYRLLARPGDSAHGLQWVGRNGGTGNQDAARVFDKPVGAVTDIPEITMDAAGTVAGTVRDEQTGQPVANACVSPYPVTFTTGSCTNLAGHYELTGLGPYRWPLEYTSDRHGWRWSGNAPNRLAATGIAVTSGAEVQADETLPVSGQVTGRVTNPPAGQATLFVAAVSAASGDYAGPLTFGPDYTLDNLSTQLVKIEFFDPTTLEEGWFRHAPSFRTALPVPVRSGHTTTGIDGGLR
jgi:hypothetical protein